MPTATNPYTHSRTENELALPVYPDAATGEYAVPDESRGAPYIRELGWAPSLRLGAESTPDASRLGSQPRRDFRPPPEEPPQNFWHALDADDALRHSVEYQDADGWTETKHFPGYSDPALGAERWARNPRRVPPPEPRPTTAMAPRTYTFTRPFMQRFARTFNGMHFSMADHRREYDILGMEPPKMRRNTYRLDPAPWDQGIVDMPPSNVPSPQDIAVDIPTVEVAYQSRSWRL